MGAPSLFGLSYYATSDSYRSRKKNYCTMQQRVNVATQQASTARVHPTRYADTVGTFVCVVGASLTFRRLLRSSVPSLICNSAFLG